MSGMDDLHNDIFAWEPHPQRIMLRGQKKTRPVEDIPLPGDPLPVAQRGFRPAHQRLDEIEAHLRGVVNVLNQVRQENEAMSQRIQDLETLRGATLHHVDIELFPGR